MMDASTVAILGFITLFTLMLLRVPVGMAMGLVGVSGFAYLVGTGPAFKIVGHTSMRTVTDYTFGVIPMFLLMGAFVTNSGMSQELFRAANAFLGHRKGGLGIATIAACGGFAAISGSSVATAATFSTVAYPEMRRYGYPQSFATGVVAAGGTLGATATPASNVPGAQDDPKVQFEAWWNAQPRIETGEGLQGAKVVVVKFNDYQCPSCRQTYVEYRGILDKFKSGGQVKFVTMDFPLDSECNTGGPHPSGCEASVAVRMAREKNRGEEMEAWLFENQARLSRDVVKEGLREVAQVTDYDARYTKTLDVVRLDVQKGQRLAFGLAAGVVSKDVSRAHRIIHRLEAGICWINTWGESPAEMPVGGYKANWGKVRADLATRQAIVERLGRKYGAPVVHFQRAFDEATKRAPADYWIWDGIHPTYSGHQVMADEWVRTARAAWPVAKTAVSPAGKYSGLHEIGDVVIRMETTTRLLDPGAYPPRHGQLGITHRVSV